MYMFIDPGKHTGWAIFDDDGNEIDVFTTNSFSEMSMKLEEYLHRGNCRNYKKVIVEEFRLYPWKMEAQMWSQFETVQVIGAIRHHCRWLEIPYEEVPARNKNIGFMYLGIKEPSHSNPLNHQMVAMAHGVFWLQNKNIRYPKER